MIGAALNLFQNLGKPLFFVTFNKGSLPPADQWNKFDAIERVTMVGCPRGLFDDINNMPIVRSGATATDIAKNFQGKNEFMVDMACFQDRPDLRFSCMIPLATSTGQLVNTPLEPGGCILSEFSIPAPS